jgi:hypothetical protein
MAAAAGDTGGVIVTLVQMEADVRDELTRFYSTEMRPFIEKQRGKGYSLAERSNSVAMFANLKTLLPQAIHPLVDDLESICEEKRELDKQIVLHRILHGWLFVHVPLSFALLLMGAMHAVIALRY